MSHEALDLEHIPLLSNSRKAPDDAEDSYQLPVKSYRKQQAENMLFELSIACHYFGLPCTTLIKQTTLSRLDMHRWTLRLAAAGPVLHCLTHTGKFQLSKKCKGDWDQSA